jgi:hypothetical protein
LGRVGRLGGCSGSWCSALSFFLIFFNSCFVFSFLSK